MVAGKPLLWPEGGRAAEVLKASDQSLKIVVPEDWKPGVFAYRLTTPGGSVQGMLNQPRVWWVQGDLGMAASPGGWVRMFGVNLCTETAPAAAPRRYLWKVPGVPAHGVR